MRKKAIYWFRNNLRIKDNPSLHKAIQENDALLPVYVINKDLFTNHKLGFPKCSKFRWKFTIESVYQLQRDLKSLGGDLLIVKGKPANQISLVAKKFDIQDIYCTREIDYNELQEEKALSAQFNLHVDYDQLLIQPNQLPFEIHDLAMVFTDFRKAIEKNMQVRPDLQTESTIKTIPFDSNLSETLQLPNFSDDPRRAFTYSGGESEAWTRLDSYFWENGNLGKYKNTRNGLIGPDYSSKFSAFLALGCISPVSIYHQVKKFEKEKIRNISTYWLIFELLWRDFFKLTSWKYGKQIFQKEGIRKVQRIYKNDASEFKKWMNGKTGNDFIDANMLELNHTGFMSNRGRQNVASYLVHDLDIDWRWGAAYFESQLIDYDCASNWCNWMYVAGVGNDPRSRKFNIMLQADKYDSKRRFRKLWLQTLLF